MLLDSSTIIGLSTLFMCVCLSCLTLGNTAICIIGARSNEQSDQEAKEWRGGGIGEEREGVKRLFFVSA
jgi:hypothetical protein